MKEDMRMLNITEEMAMEQATVEEAHIPSNPSIGNKQTLNDNDDDERMENEEFVKKVYLSCVDGPNRWDGVSNESVYERCGMRGRGSGVGRSVVEWVTRSTQRWFGHIEKMEYEEFVAKVYLSSAEGMTRRGRPLGRWEDRVKEYMSEMGVRGNESEWARRESMDRERWRSVCRGHTLGGCLQRERGIRAID